MAHHKSVQGSGTHKVLGREAPDATGSPPAIVTSPTTTLGAAEHADPHPVLSRNIELTVQRAIDTTLDRSRYEVQLVKCRVRNRQIFSNPQVSGADSDWPSIVEAIVSELTIASFRNPDTGADLKPMVQSISRGRAEGSLTVTIIGFQ